MKIIYTLIIISMFYSSALGQVNIESFRNSATKTGFYGTTKGNISLQHGNVNSQNYELSNDLHYKLNIHHLLLKASISKGYQDKEQYRNNAFVHFRYTSMLHDFIGYEVFTQTQYDEFKDLSLRQLNGAGIRYEKTISKDKLFQFAIGTGLMTDHEVLVYETTTHIRSTSYISATKNFNTDGSSFISVVSYYQPLVFNHKDYRVNNELNLRSSIINKKLLQIGLNITLVYMYDTVPAIKIQNTDLLLKTGLSIAW